LILTGVTNRCEGKEMAKLEKKDFKKIMHSRQKSTTTMRQLQSNTSSLPNKNNNDCGQKGIGSTTEIKNQKNKQKKEEKKEKEKNTRPGRLGQPTIPYTEIVGSAHTSNWAT